MHLKRLEIKGLHGSLDKTIDFNKDLNLLVGINGSGKTSVLNTIDWLLRPNFRHLATTQFELLKLTLDFNESEMIIEAKQTKALITVGVTYRNVIFKPISVNLRKYPGEFISEEERYHFLSKNYSSLRPEPHEVPLWSFYTQLPKPIVIALDRTISAETEEAVYREALLPFAREDDKKRKTPMSKVEEVTSAHFAQYQNKVIELNDKLKAKIVMSALTDPFEEPANRQGKTRLDINLLEKKVISYLSASIPGADVAEKVKSYFRQVNSVPARIRHVLGRSKISDQDLMWIWCAITSSQP
jgi:hypothetical protein